MVILIDSGQKIEKTYMKLQKSGHSLLEKREMASFKKLIVSTY